MPKDVTRRFWLTVKTPADAKPGVYRGTVTVTPEQGQPAEVPIEFRVRAGTLDPVDIPAGPVGPHDRHPLARRRSGRGGLEPRAWRSSSLRKIREYGFTTCSGIPSIAYRGFKDGKPVLDFTAADAQMKHGQGPRLPGRRVATAAVCRGSTPTIRTRPR